MHAVSAQGIRLEYDVHGDGEPVLLIMGLGAQMILWPEEFRQHLVDGGFRVVRFDNRDVGLSTRGEERPPVVGFIAAHLLNRPPRATPSYTLADMAEDARAVMDHLGLPSAHVVGASMGGMIAQELALRHPKRVKSLGLIMTTPGGRWLGRPTALTALLRPRGSSREQVIQATVKLMNTIGGTLPIDQQRLQDLCTQAYDRSYHPIGFQRQLVAVLSAPDRTERLATLRLPTVVIHGSADPLVPPAAGRALARAIPDARWVEVDGMGHSLPPAAWPTLLTALLENMRRVR
jgi:pimeloyl-ACP methyl ester carboxylesterase